VFSISKCYNVLKGDIIINNTKILNQSFFEKYYIDMQMSFPEISKMLYNKGTPIATSTLYKYAKKIGISRSISEGKRLSQNIYLDYKQTFINESIIECIDGFLLGDGHIDLSSSKQTLVARLTCGLAYQEFCEYLMSFFSNYNSSCTPYKDKKMSSGIQWQGRTSFHPDLYIQHKRWYPQDKKKQPPQDVRLTPTSVLLWYLGDGSQVQSGNSISVRLSTDGFSPKNNEFLVKQLNELGISCHRNNDNRIYIEAKGIPDFFNFIGKESPIECYSYKFDLPEWRFASKRMREVAEELKIDYNKLSYWVKTNKIPCFRTDPKGKPRFLTEHIQEIKQFIASHEDCLQDIINVFSTETIQHKINGLYFPKHKFLIQLVKNIESSEKNISHTDAYKKQKNILTECRTKGIRLFLIFENQWRERKEQILNFLTTIIQKNSVIAARKCSINNENCKVFVNQNHIQGYGIGTIKFFNLIYNNEIVASMTVSKHHRQNIEGNPLILNRLCFKNGYTIQGGASKLFKYLKNWAIGEGYDRIISWSDSCWTEGKIYEILDFELVKEYDPDYFYWDSINNKYLSKQSQKKSNTGCPKEITEKEWALQKGLFRIWNCGKKLWQYEKG